jgi:hypothetical protein
MAHVRHAWLYQCSVRAIRNRLKWNGGAYGGVWGSLESDGRFCVGSSGKNLASVAVKMFLHLIYFTNKLYVYI